MSKLVSARKRPLAVLYRNRANQAASHLRDAIRQGRWPGGLPAERHLAAEMGVSRMTLREALLELQRDGTLRAGRTQAEAPERLCVNPAKVTRSVGLIAPSHLHRLSAEDLLIVDELRRRVYGKRLTLEIYENSSSSPGRYFAFTRRMMRKERHDSWVLLSSTREIQAWCQASKLPVVLAGTSYQGIALPSVDVDYRALCNHAVGQMTRCGHHHLALILPQKEHGGDIESREGFLEAVARVAGRGVRGTLQHSGQSMADLCHTVDRLLKMPARPTAWLIGRAATFLTVSSYLSTKNVRIPADLSLISRDSPAWLPHLVPAPARYVYNANQVAKQVASLVFKTAGSDLLTKTRIRQVPEFLPGQSLARCLSPSPPRRSPASR